MPLQQPSNDLEALAQGIVTTLPDKQTEQPDPQIDALAQGIVTGLPDKPVGRPAGGGLVTEVAPPAEIERMAETAATAYQPKPEGTYLSPGKPAEMGMSRVPGTPEWYVKGAADIGKSAIQGGKTLLGGAMSSGAQAMANYDQYAQKLAKLGAKVIPGADYDDLYGGLFKGLSENWGYWGDRLKKEGITVPILKDVVSGVGGAAFDIPHIAAFGKWGLPVQGAVMGGAEGGVKGAIEGGIHGAVTHGFLKGLGELPSNLRIPGFLGFGAATTPGGLEERTTGALTWAALGLAGGNKKISYSEFISRYPKIQEKIDVADSWRVLKQIAPGISPEEVAAEGGPKVVLQRAMEEVRQLDEQLKAVEAKKAEPGAAETARVPPPPSTAVAAPGEAIPKASEAARAADLRRLKWPDERAVLQKKIDAGENIADVLDYAGERYPDMPVGEYPKPVYEYLDATQKAEAAGGGEPIPDVVRKTRIDALKRARGEEPPVPERFVPGEAARPGRDAIDEARQAEKPLPRKTPMREAGDLAAVEADAEATMRRNKLHWETTEDLTQIQMEHPGDPEIFGAAQDLMDIVRLEKRLSDRAADKPLPRPIEFEEEAVTKPTEVNVERDLPGVLKRMGIPRENWGAITERVMKSYSPEEGSLEGYVYKIGSKYITEEGEPKRRFRVGESRPVPLEKKISPESEETMVQEGELAVREGIEGEPVATPEKRLAIKEEKARVSKIFKGVSRDKNDQRILEARISEQKTYAEIGEELGISMDSARRRYKRLENKLQKDPETRKVYQEHTGNSLRAYMEELRPEMEAEAKKDAPKVGLGIKHVKDVAKAREEYKKSRQEFKFQDETLQENFERDHGRPVQSATEKAVAGLQTFRHRITRVYEHLPRGGTYSEALTQLKFLEKQRDVSWDKTVRAIQGITLKANRRNHSIFEKTVLINDLMEEIKAGHDLPWDTDYNTIRGEKARLDQEIANNPEVQRALKTRREIQERIVKDYQYRMKEAGFDVESRLTKADYFRHEVMEFAGFEGKLRGAGKKLKTPTGRGFLQERKGSKLGINTDYLEVESSVMSQMIYDTSLAETIVKLRDVYDISGKVKADAKARGLENWREAIPEGHSIFQPQEGNVFYMANTLSERIAKQLLTDQAEMMNITKENIGKALSMGGKRPEWVIPNELAKTLDNLMQRDPPKGLKKVNKAMLTGWKVWTLISPRRGFKYNVRNLTGDADALMVGNPAAFKQAPGVMLDLWKVFVNKEPMPRYMQDWFNRGGMQSTLQAQEIGGVKSLRMFKSLYDKKGRARDLPKTVWQKYWRIARMGTDFREAILRLSAYKDYLGQIKGSPKGEPKNFGASIPEEVLALRDPKDKAFRLSNELLGAYDEISVLGEEFREQMYPFWSFKELNFRRYKRMAQNAARDKKVTAAVGRKMVGSLARTPYTAMRVGSFVLKATAFSNAIAVWNHVAQPGVEEDLPKDVRDRPHVNLGRDENGEPKYFTRVGALGDFMEWFGMDVYPHHMESYLRGEKSIKEIAVDIAKGAPAAFVEQIYRGLHPGKSIVEGLAQRTLFPDVFKPRPIRDIGVFAARQFGMEDLYKAIAGVPSKPYKESLKKIFYYTSDPDETAYYELGDLGREFSKKVGKERDMGVPKGRTKALLDLKSAVRYGNKRAEMKALKTFIGYHVLEAGLVGKSWQDVRDSVEQGINNSFSSLAPLSSMSKDLKKAFLRSLDEDQHELVVRAIKYWAEVLVGPSKYTAPETIK